MSLVRRLAVPLAAPCLLATVWWWISRTGLVPPYLLPSPRAVGAALGGYILGRPGGDAFAGRFVVDLVASLGRAGCGFALAAALGLPLGIVCGRTPLLARALAPLVDGLRSVPGICWLPLALVWFGIGFGATLFLVALAAFFPIYLNAAAGAAAVPTVLIQAGAMLGLSPAAVFLKVVLPAAMPSLRTGLRLGLGVSFAYLGLGELTGVSDGLGAMVMDARLTGRVDMILTGIVLLAVLGWLADILLRLALRAAFTSARRS